MIRSQSMRLTLGDSLTDFTERTHSINEGIDLISMKGPCSDMEPVRKLLNEVLKETKN
jgi:hypothetical protein